VVNLKLKTKGARWARYCTKKNFPIVDALLNFAHNAGMIKVRSFLLVIVVLCVLGGGLGVRCLGLGQIKNGGQVSHAKDNQVLQYPNGSFRVGELGSEWKLVETGIKAATWQHRITGATLSASASCPWNQEEAPLFILAQQAQASINQRTLLEQKSRTIDGREALYQRSRGKVDGVDLVLEIMVVKKNGCGYELTGIQSGISGAKPSVDFKRFFEGFRVEKTPTLR
jgi:hypothetical protein